MFRDKTDRRQGRAEALRPSRRFLRTPAGARRAQRPGHRGRDRRSGGGTAVRGPAARPVLGAALLGGAAMAAADGAMAGSTCPTRRAGTPPRGRATPCRTWPWAR